MIGTSKVQECSDGVGGDGWGRGGIMQSWGEWITAVAACFRVLENTRRLAHVRTQQGLRTKGLEDQGSRMAGVTVKAHLRGGSWGLVPSLNTRETRTPTPSNTLSKIPHITADVRAPLGPLRAARHPPVIKPEMMAFHMSSFCRQPLTAQSNVENMPPQTPKLPPVTGARALMTERAPTIRSPYVAGSVAA